MAARGSSTRCATRSATGSSPPTRPASRPRSSAARDGILNQPREAPRNERREPDHGHGPADAGEDPRASPSTAAAIPAIEGDTLASALIANGIHLTGRSFKYHRPRGILSAGPEEPNALVDIEPRFGAPDAECAGNGAGGLRRPEGESQNRWPSLAFDVGGVNNLPRRCLPPASTTRPSCGRRRPGSRSTSRSSALRPASASRPSEPDPDHYANRYVHCDVLVIGGGAAGLSAALAAAAGGRARDPLRRAARNRRRAPLTRPMRRSTARPAGTGRRRRRRSSRPWTMSAC